MELPEDISDKLRNSFRQSADLTEATELISSLWNTPLNVGAAQLARAILILSDGDIAKLKDVFQSNFYGDPRDILVMADDKIGSPGLYFVHPLYEELIADIYYLAANEGGRKTAVYTKYRGQFHYNGKDWDAQQTFIDKRICEPGDRVKVYLRMASPGNHIGQFSIGMNFEIREGPVTVGKGTITQLLREDYKQNQ